MCDVGLYKHYTLGLDSGVRKVGLIVGVEELYSFGSELFRIENSKVLKSKWEE